MSHYKPYPAYKDSSIEWLGQVPEHWSQVRLKYLFSEKKTQRNSDLPCGAISFGNVVYKDSESIPSETRATYQEVLCDQFLINPINLNYDLKSLRTALSDINVCVSSAYIVLIAIDSAEKRFLKYLLYCFDVLHMKTLGAGVRQTITFNDIGGCYVFLPTLKEQQFIATYLDRETTRIDDIVNAKTRFIELLREKRQSLITHVVTKGLDPNVKMKDSGVEWLGQVPATWSKIRLKYLFTEKKKLNAPNLPCGAISFGNVIYKNNESIPVGTRATYQEVLSGEFLINPINLNYDLKSLRTALSEISVCVSPAYIVLHANDDSEKNFLKYLFYCFDILHMKTLGAGVRQTITFNDIGGCYVCIPSLCEQRTIAAYLDRETARIEALIVKTECSIELLKERRPAIITAAVTGQIDLREVKE